MVFIVDNINELGDLEIYGAWCVAGRRADDNDE
jgi:hypothetical protein